MATGAPMPMNTGTRPMTERGLLVLAQWFSPAYPLGSFAYSHGLEAAVTAGWVEDAESLQDWLEDVLRHGSGRSDVIFLRLAHGEDADIAGLDSEARAYAPSRERLREAERQGAAFARTTRDIWGIDLPDAVLPVAVGRAVRLLGLDVDMAVALYLQGFAGNLVSAAQRLLALGQTEAQGVVAALHPVCAQVARDSRDTTLDDLFSICFLSDVAAMKHEIQEPRIFQS